MRQKRHTVDQIIGKLRQADVELGKGHKVPKVCKLLEITEQTSYRWRQKYGEMQSESPAQARSLKCPLIASICSRWRTLPIQVKFIRDSI